MRASVPRYDVCMLTTGFPRFEGDLFGSFVLELARGLQRQGLRVGVLAPHEAGIPRSETVDGIEVYRFRYFLTRWQRVAYRDGIPTNLRSSWAARLQLPLFLLGFWLATRCHVGTAQIVHCHWSVSGLVAWLARRRGAQRLVLSVRGSDVNLMKSAWATAVNRFICRRMDAVVAVSDELAMTLRRIGVPSSCVHVIPNGVDPRFRPGDRRQLRLQLHLRVDAFVLLFVGLMVPVKGLDVLFGALEAYAGDDWLCVLVGDGALRPKFEARAAAVGLGPRVHFAGRRPSTEVPWWMGAADVFVLPSRSEGRPNVVLEAQACGLPVVATRVGGTAELVIEDETAFLVPPDDVTALGEALARLALDRPRCRRMGEAARAHVESGDFSWETSARTMECLYRDVLGTSV